MLSGLAKQSHLKNNLFFVGSDLVRRCPYGAMHFKSGRGVRCEPVCSVAKTGRTAFLTGTPMVAGRWCRLGFGKLL